MCFGACGAQSMFAVEVKTRRPKYNSHKLKMENNARTGWTRVGRRDASGVPGWHTKDEQSGWYLDER